MNVYIFMMTSIGIFLVQLFAYLAIFWIIVVIVGHPIKILTRKMRQLINRANR